MCPLMAASASSRFIWNPGPLAAIDGGFGPRVCEDDQRFIYLPENRLRERQSLISCLQPVSSATHILVLLQYLRTGTD